MGYCPKATSGNGLTPSTFAKAILEEPVACLLEFDKHTYASLAYSQDFSKIFWRVKIWSVLPQPNF